MEYTVAEVEEVTGVSRETVRAMLRDQLLDGYMEDGVWILPDESVELLMDLTEDEDLDDDEDE